MSQPILPLDQVIPGDCRHVLATLPEKSVDLIFADPPYNLQLQNTLYRPNNTRVEAVNDAWDQFGGFEEYDRFTEEWLKACRRVLKDNGTLWVIGTYHNIFRVGKLLQDLDFWILNSVVWVKANPMPNFRGVRFTNSHEVLVWAQKRRSTPYTFNHQAMKALNDDLQMRSDWYLPLCTGKERLKVNGTKAHATQKPEALLYRVILSSSKPGDVVLDPFFGSGTTGAVAKLLHRHWIGIESQASYVEIARQRIEQVEPAPFSSTVFQFDSKRARPRLSLGLLLECGLVKPGQRLYLGESSQQSAIILANGHIQSGELTGSIHQVAKALKNASCNGWDQWYYDDPQTGKRRVIDTLRQKLHDDYEAQGNGSDPQN